MSDTSNKKKLFVQKKLRNNPALWERFDRDFNELYSGIEFTEEEKNEFCPEGTWSFITWKGEGFAKTAENKALSKEEHQARRKRIAQILEEKLQNNPNLKARLDADYAELYSGYELDDEELDQVAGGTVICPPFCT